MRHWTFSVTKLKISSLLEVHKQRAWINATRSEFKMNPSSAMIRVEQQAVQGEKFYETSWLTLIFTASLGFTKCQNTQGNKFLRKSDHIFTKTAQTPSNEFWSLTFIKLPQHVPLLSRQHASSKASRKAREPKRERLISFFCIVAATIV